MFCRVTLKGLSIKQAISGYYAHPSMLTDKSCTLQKDKLDPFVTLNCFYRLAN